MSGFQHTPQSLCIFNMQLLFADAVQAMPAAGRQFTRDQGQAAQVECQYHAPLQGQAAQLGQWRCIPAHNLDVKLVKVVIRIAYYTGGVANLRRQGKCAELQHKLRLGAAAGARPSSVLRCFNQTAQIRQPSHLQAE